MAARLITITGPTGSGKSTLLKDLLALADDRFQPVVVSKYSTRPPRPSDGSEVISVETIPPSCDLVYEQYRVRYGLEKRTLLELLCQQRTPIVILNDIRVVEDIRRHFGRIVRSAYVYRKAPSLDAFTALATERSADQTEYTTRFRKAQAIHRIYIENISIFDWVILNVGSRQRMKTQIKRLVAADQRELAPARWLKAQR